MFAAKKRGTNLGDAPGRRSRAPFKGSARPVEEGDDHDPHELVRERGEAVDDRRTAEIWTFQRNLKSADPNWILIHVDAAEA